MKKLKTSENDEKKHFTVLVVIEVTLGVQEKKSSRRYNWFKLWIEEGYSVRELARMDRVSQSTVRRVIQYWLD